MSAAKKEVIPGYLSTEQAADVLGYSPQRVRQLKTELGGIDTPGILYPAAVVKEFAKRPRPKPGRKPAKDT